MCRTGYMARLLRVAHRSRQSKHISCGYKFSSACTGVLYSHRGMFVPRINVEEKWWTDERRYKLADKLGGDLRLADGMMIEVWALAQRFWGHGRKKIPINAFNQIRDHQLLFDCDLAAKHGGFVMVRGTREFAEWYASLLESSAKGGKSKGKRGKQNASKTLANSYPLTLTHTLPLTLTHKEEENMSPAAQSAGADAMTDKLAKIWNQECGTLPKVKILSKQRERKAKAAWSRHPSEEFWIQVIARIRASPFCTGSSDRGWVANFDFLVKPDTPARVLEGVYDRRDSMGFTQEQIEQNRRMRDELDRSFEDSPA